MKKVVAITISFLCSVAIVVFLPHLFRQFTTTAVNQTQTIGKFEQKITAVNAKPHKVYKLYDHGEVVGVLQSKQVLDQHLKQVYQQNYAEAFPHSSAQLGTDVYLTDEESYYSYTNADDSILSYLDQNELYAIACSEVIFRNGDKVTGRMFVSDMKDYEEAMNEYISYFADQASVASYRDTSTVSSLTSYGTQDIGVSIQQTITIEDAYTSVDNIKRDKDSVLEYLKYSDTTEKEYYTVTAYDTVSGVGAKNYGLSATQIMNLNRDKISSVDQVLEEGGQLCVTYFQSPVDVVVYKRRLSKETVFFDTIYTEDENILKGDQEVRQDGVNGSRNALYTEKWINGVLTSGTLESSVETKSPTSEVVALGTKALPGVGTGTLRYPVENAGITCPWGCYYGHTGTDFVDQYNSWGDVHAADTGVVEKVAYDGISGNYIVINHNTGYSTYYGHMRVPSDLSVGTIVEKGDVIGHIGMTGRATGPHVHFHIVQDGTIKNACDGFMDCSGVPRV